MNLSFRSGPTFHRGAAIDAAPQNSGGSRQAPCVRGRPARARTSSGQLRGRDRIERMSDARRLRVSIQGASPMGAVRRAASALAFIAAIVPATVAAQDVAIKPPPTAVPPLPPARPADIAVGVGVGVANGEALAPAAPAPTTPPVAQTPTALTEAPPATAPQNPQASAWKAGATGPLPVASRRRMHECGLEWQKMKMSGQAVDKSWRDFAEICLSR